MMSRGHPIFTNGLIIALVLAAAACGDAVGPYPQPEGASAPIAFARVTITPSGDPVIPGTRGSDPDPYGEIRTVAHGSDATITLPRGTATVTITAEWLNASGGNMPALLPDELELSVTGREFTMEQGTFSGTISGLYTGSHALTVRAWHREEARFVFGAVLYLVVKGDECELDPCFGPWDY